MAIPLDQLRFRKSGRAPDLGLRGRALLAPRRPPPHHVPRALPERQLHPLPVQQAHRLRGHHARPEHRADADRHGGPDRRHGHAATIPDGPLDARRHQGRATA
ncbi:MAG: hypothetical protein MZV64_43880 [Ignavibacteriales bacterium]|nr:hypothetical protein [Ignavibacteriales bacterium]